MEQKNNQQKRDIWFGKDKNKFTNPRWTAKIGLGTGVILILLNILLIPIFKTYSRSPVWAVPIIFGIIGIYYGIKQRTKIGVIFLNLLAIILGLVSFYVTVFMLDKIGY